jgi:outer membrane protein insertion porin family/translocation and assembly module TamA
MGPDSLGGEDWARATRTGPGAAACLVVLGALVSTAGASTGCASIPPGRAAVDSIDFLGVHRVSEKELGDKIATTPSPAFLGLFRGLVYDYALYDPYVLRTDLQRIARYYRARGFYEAQVRAGRVEYSSPQHVRITVEVEEGLPVRVDVVVVDGLDELPRSVQNDVQRALALSGLGRGRRFDEDQFARAEWHVLRALQDDAYAFAKVEREAHVNLPAHLAEVYFHVTPSEPATFGPISVVGLGSLPEEPVLRALAVREGQRYSASALDAAQQAVLDLGVFSSVSITPNKPGPPPPDRTVPVTVQVTPTRLHTIRLGGGVELDIVKTNVYALAGWSDRNFFGGMRRFDVDVRPGIALYPTRLPDLEKPTNILPEERFQAQLRQPGLFEARTTGFVRGQVNVYPLLVTPNVDLTAPVIGYGEARATVGADRQFWKLFAELTYSVQYNAPFAYVGQLDPDLRTALVGYASLLTNFDFRDDRVEPHEGFLLGNELQLAGGPLGGDAQDVRVQPQARAYVPLGRATLALRATTGVLLPANYGGALERSTPGEVPPGVERATWVRDLQLVYFRGFFSGGSTSNRGYPVYGVGPHGPVPFLTPNIGQLIYRQCIPGTETYDPGSCALPLGGLTLWEASAEVRVPLSSQFAAATFCDASDVEVGQVNYHLEQPHLSCGGGLRLKTPVGPVRLDVAYRIPGLNPRPGDPDYPGDVFGVPISVAFGVGEAF